MRSLILFAVLFTTTAFGQSYNSFKEAPIEFTITDEHPFINEANLVDLLNRNVILNIDSGGGYVHTFKKFGDALERLKERGGTVTCYIKRAYSMGFYTASLCDKRYFYADGTGMTHDPFFGCFMCKVTTESARDLLYTANMLHGKIRKTFDTIYYWQLVKQEKIMTVRQMMTYVPSFVDGIVDSDREIVCTDTEQCEAYLDGYMRKEEF